MTAKSAARAARESRPSRVLILVDESNVLSSARMLGRNLDWIRLRDHLLAAGAERSLLEMVVYIGLPPAMPEWQTERDKKLKFVHWLRTNGFLVVAKDGSPSEDNHYKANVDVLMAIDGMDLCTAMVPDTVMLVTGDADFAPLALALRRRGIRVEAAAASANLGGGLRGAVNAVIDLGPLFESFDPAETAGGSSRGARG